jgi:hypothetical protein
MKHSLDVVRGLVAGCIASAVLLTVRGVRGDAAVPSRVWSVVMSGWNLPTEQSAHEVYPGPGPRTWRVTLHPRQVSWYRVQAYAEGAAPVTAQLTAAGRPVRGVRQLNAAAAFPIDWIVCTSPANAPLVLEVQASGPTEWAFGLWIPPVTVPIGPCP